MILFKRQSHLGIAFFTAVLGLWLPRSESSPFVISDDRIRGLDVTPVLGRGYSIATNSFQSTCLVIEETTIPSYNYDYYFTDLTNSETAEAKLQGKISGSFGYFGIKGSLNAKYKQTSKFERQKHIVAATMRIERFYSSLKEEESRLSRDAEMLLQNDDYVGFFKSCGPNYVRSIRRAQEVTAIFEFEATSAAQAQEFASSFEISGWGQSISASLDVEKKHSVSTSSLRIKIMGFGLGLGEEGSQTLVATSMEEYNEVMKFAFKSMTQTENHDHIGMIYGLELVPWVDNTSFQAAAKIDEKQIEIPMPRSVIPRAQTVEKDEKTKKKKVFSKENREHFFCKDPAQNIDKFGLCCFEDVMEKASKKKADDENVSKLTVFVSEDRETIDKFETPQGNVLKIEDNKLKSDDREVTANDSKFTITNGEVLTFDENGALRTTGGDIVTITGSITDSEKTAITDYDSLSDPLDQMICKPLRSLHPSIKKNNMSNNGEFVALLDSLVRYRLNTLFSLEKCITALNSLPRRYDYYFLRAQDNVKYDGQIEAKYTVAELRLALDPFEDYALVRHMGDELDEFLEMFYDPCISDIFGINVGTKAGSDPKYFLAESWHHHESCSKLSCLADNMRWDREVDENGKHKGCVPSLITGPSAGEYEYEQPATNQMCSKKVNDDGNEECSINSNEKADYQNRLNECWNNGNTVRAVKSPVYLMDHFCNPVVSDTQAPEEVQTEIKELVDTCKTEQKKSPKKEKPRSN